MTGPTVRPGADVDVPAITVLYNHYIASSAHTFDVEPVTETSGAGG